MIEAGLACSRETMNLGTSMTVRSRGLRWHNISPLFGSFLDFLVMRFLAALRTFRSEFSNRTAEYRFSQNLDIVHEDKAICLTYSRPHVFFNLESTKAAPACLLHGQKLKPLRPHVAASTKVKETSYDSYNNAANRRVKTFDLLCG